MITFLLIIALLIAIIAVIFAIQNTAVVVVSFFTWQFEQSLALVLLLTVIVGVLIGILTVLPGSLRSKWQLTSQRKKLDALEKKLKEEISIREEIESTIQEMQNLPPVESDQSLLVSDETDTSQTPPDEPSE